MFVRSMANLYSFMPLEVKAFYLFSYFPEVYSLEVSLKSQLLKSIKSRMQETVPGYLC